MEFSEDGKTYLEFLNDLCEKFNEEILRPKLETQGYVYLSEWYDYLRKHDPWFEDDVFLASLKRRDCVWVDFECSERTEDDPYIRLDFEL